VSTLNAVTGAVTANAAIVPAGDGGGIDVFAQSETDLVIDINGYFAPAAAEGLSLYICSRAARLTRVRQTADSRSPAVFLWTGS
jgi:hypothetical protein